MKNFINLKDISAIDLRRIIEDAKDVVKVETNPKF